jgi:hypothetical protein
MRQIRICLVLIAGVVSGGTSSATAATTTPLDLSWGLQGYIGGEPIPPNPLKPGEEVRVRFVETNFATSLGQLTCLGANFPGEGLFGTDLTNNKPTDKIQIQEAFGGLGNHEQCSNATLLPSPALISIYSPTYPSAFGVLSLSAKGKATFKSTTTSEPVYVKLTFGEGAKQIKCFFSFTKLSGKLTHSPHGYLERTEVSFKQKLTFVTALSNPACPKAATITVPLAYPMRNSQSEAETGYFLYETGLL